MNIVLYSDIEIQHFDFSLFFNSEKLDSFYILESVDFLKFLKNKDSIGIYLTKNPYIVNIEFNKHSFIKANIFDNEDSYVKSLHSVQSNLIIIDSTLPKNKILQILQEII